ncbi:hypothetical protein PA7559_29260 [Pseudoalteromonas distincta]
MRRSQVAKLYEDIERNVADAGVYQHLIYIATGRLFFPQEISEIRSTIYLPLNFIVGLLQIYLLI